MGFFPAQSGGGSYRLVETATGTSSQVAAKIATIETAYDALTEEEKANAFIVMGTSASVNGQRYVNNGGKIFARTYVSYTSASVNSYMVSQIDLANHTHYRYSYNYDSSLPTPASQGVGASAFGSSLYLYTKG